ncbi:MAG: membrane protein insertase YidC [Bacteroidota bacterium]|nr:membrane protein insertase YidC [Bacteroidota bacterium]
MNQTDRQTTLGFILIAVVLMIWMWWSAPKPAPPAKTEATALSIDSLKKTRSAGEKPSSAIAKSQVRSSVPVTHPPSEEKFKVPKSHLQAGALQDSLGKFFSAAGVGTERIITIETDNYIAEVSTRGGVIKKWELKKYKTWSQAPVQLVQNTASGDFSLLFTSSDGKLIDTRSLYFTTDTPSSRVHLSGDKEYKIDFVLAAGDGRIVKTLTFKNGTYTFDADFRFDHMDSIIANYEYQVVWEDGLRYAEYNSIDESRYAKAYSYAGGEVTDIDASSQGETPVSNTNGSTEWVASTTKYFGIAILTHDKKAEGAYLEGEHLSQPDNGVVKRYSIALKMPFQEPGDDHVSLSVFLGPLDFKLVKGMERGLDNIIYMGWSWLRPITEYVFIPLFRFLHSFISNFGIVIIVFSIIVKVALNPLTKSSMKSMKKMQALQPMMQEIRTKYKADPTKMNEQVMKLYRDYGVNPAGGCLPMLLQMPILYALYAVFTNSIELRQANFIWWITDLSNPDPIIHLPFTIPIVGMYQISGLALFMAITTFIQQKMTVQDPRQKTMIWMMPVMMMLIFNNLPSGLNLYYFVFNILSIGQQLLINKQHDNMPLQKVPQKKRPTSLMEALSRTAAERAKRK